MLPTTAPTKDRSAYTLIELLLAMVLSTTVLAALWSLLSIYTTLFDTAGVETEQAQLARAVLVMIETDLAGVVPDTKVSKKPTGSQTSASDADHDGGSATAPDVATTSDTLAATPTPEVTDDADTDLGDGEFTGSATSTVDAADAFSSHLSGGMTAGSHSSAFAQPSLIGDSETLWLVVRRPTDLPASQDHASTFTTDTTFEPADELAIVEYALTYRDAANAMGTMIDAPSSLFEQEESDDSSEFGDASAAEGLDRWGAVANSEMETAAAQLGLIDREAVDASRGMERREAPWPVSPPATHVVPASSDAALHENSLDDEGDFAGRRAFIPPIRVADINNPAAGRSAASLGGRGADSRSDRFHVAAHRRSGSPSFPLPRRPRLAVTMGQSCTGIVATGR